MKTTLAYISNFFILRRNAVLLLVIAGFSYYWYHEFSSLPGDQARVQIVLSILALFACTSVLAFGLITTILPYLSLIFKKRILETDDDEKQDIIKLGFRQTSPTPGLVDTEARIYGIRRPFLGFLKVTVFFEDNVASDEILVNEVLRENGKRMGILGRKQMLLPHVRDYRFRSAIIHFEDFFHLFALPYRESEHLGVFTEPPKTLNNGVLINTKSSEDPVKKVIQHRTAKGELLDYKKYAPGDDIRRIIWKNYARSRELTVRIHDRTFPYVSHINVLASFYDASPTGGQPLPLKDLLLDIYKEKIRQVIDAIIEQGFSVRFFVDQSIEQHYQLDEYQQMLYSVSAAKWQSGLSIEQFMKDRYYELHKGSTVLLFSSFCPIQSLEQLQNGRPLDVNMAFYNATKTLDLSKPPSILKRILFTDAFEPLEFAKREKTAPKTVKFIKQNDAAIESLLDRYRQSVIEI